MAATIQYLFEGRYGGMLELDDEPVVIGQARDCTIRKKDKLLARRHARIHQAGAPKALVHRDKIKCGSLELEYFEK
jgi:pSer/pThr/pTyr-binding forkhead associated (FHA) protein